MFLEEFKIHMSLLFEKGMTWENYGQWEIDHIKPLILFDLTQESELMMAGHYTNLQPLWASDNRSKSDKYETKVSNENKN